MNPKILEKLSDKKNLLFLIMCLAVHMFNAFLFFRLQILPLFVINCVSSSFYIVVLLIFNKNNEVLIVLTYFEVILFSLCSELFAGGQFGYIDYTIGMVGCVFYLLPSDKKHKHLYQFIGVLFAIMIFQISSSGFMLLPSLQPKIMQYKKPIGYLNLGITLFSLFYVSNLYLVELNLTREKLSYTSNHDMLTGLYNRRFFEGIMKRSKEEKENKYSIAMFDVDDFKKVNDTYGHEAGDMILETVSRIMSGKDPENSVAVRWGGEEFILYMPLTDSDEALEVLEHIVEEIRENTQVYKGCAIKITVTVGLSTGIDIADYQEVIREADEKLYWGKTHGKNQIVREIAQGV